MLPAHPMPEALAVFSAADLPPELAELVPAPLREAGQVFWLANTGSAAVRAVFDAVPEPPMADTLVEGGLKVARLLSRVIADSPTFRAQTRCDRGPGATIVISYGFHTGDPVAVRAAFAEVADPKPLEPYLDELRVARICIGGVPSTMVLTTHPPQRARALGDGWFALDPGAQRVLTAGGGGAIAARSVQLIDLPAPASPPDPIDEDAVAARLHHHFTWTPVIWEGSEEWGAVVVRSGGLTVLRGNGSGLTTRGRRQQARWLPDGPTGLARFDAWASAYRAAWLADGPDIMRPLQLLDAALLARAELQSEEDFARYVFDLDALSRLLAPEAVARRVPEAAGLPEALLVHVWFWLPEVAHRYASPVSPARLRRLPEPVVLALARAWIAGPPGYDLTPDVRIEARGIQALRKVLGKVRLQSLIDQHRSG